MDGLGDGGGGDDGSGGGKSLSKSLSCTEIFNTTCARL